MKKLLLTLSVLTFGLILVACDDNNSEPNEPVTIDTSDVDVDDNAEEVEELEETEPDYLTLGSTFEFDNLEITLGTDIVWLTVDNEFSDNSGADVFRLPITITNLADETHGLNMFDVVQFGSSGTRLDSISAFFDDDVDWAGQMRSGATLESYMHILYDGDGEYVLEFDDWGNDVIEVIFQIEK